MILCFINQTSKDLWSDDTTQTAAQRSAVAGYAYIGQVCNSYAVSIVEDFGGFSNIVVSYTPNNKVTSRF